MTVTFHIVYLAKTCHTAVFPSNNDRKCKTQCSIKGKLPHNFMVSFLLLISCLPGMARTYITEENAKINTFCSYRAKKIKFGNSQSLGFPISPCATSLEGEFPRNCH